MKLFKIVLIEKELEKKVKTENNTKLLANLRNAIVHKNSH